MNVSPDKPSAHEGARLQAAQAGGLDMARSLTGLFGPLIRSRIPNVYLVLL